MGGNGWVVPSEREKEGRRPERTNYKLTDSGREVFLRVVSDIIAQPSREYPHFSAGLMFMHHLTSTEASQHLRNRALALKALTTKLSAILSELHGNGLRRPALLQLQPQNAMLHAERRWGTALP